ncbi:MAG: MarR family winged helix-turn-helix transcriptional regulator [Janthinobacterium lividum]
MTSTGQPAGDADPTLTSSLQPLRDLLSAMDADIARLYEQRGVAGVRPRFSMALIRLHHRGPMSVKQLAEQVEVTHSAMSQTVTVMRRDGLVDTLPGADARTRTVSLTPTGEALVPFLEAEWRATEAAWAELEAEIPYALTRVVADLGVALERRSFLHRISARLRAQEEAGTGTATTASSGQGAATHRVTNRGAPST